MCSNIHELQFFSVDLKIDWIPFSLIRTASPGSISLMNFAPRLSNAQLSDASINPSFKLPTHKGLTPNGSLIPIIPFSVKIVREYAPFNFLIR